jgi:hypothetical protein
MNAPRFPPDAVAQIRSLHSRGMLNVRAWAQAYNVSLETVRRIARGDTYRGGNEPLASSAQVIPPATPPQGGEPDEGALAASFARLLATQAAETAVPPAQDLLDEMLARGRDQPGLSGVHATRPTEPPPDE